MVQFDRLLDVISALRAPDGCPWDKEQTHRSLTPFLIEEAYECVEAIETFETGGDANLIEELGDVLLQVVLHAQIASETGRFTIASVVQTLSDKMIRRHPHVFATTKADAKADIKLESAEQVLTQWQEIKKAEKPKPKGFDFGLPGGLPALARAAKIGEKTARLKFDWPDARAVFEKVREEFHELEAELKAFTAPLKPIEEPELGPSRHPLRHEIGDLLFSVAQFARHTGLDPEQCLRDATHRFERRFQATRQLAEADHKDWMTLTEDQREAYWGKVKAQEKL